jgi:hypothetical protein
MSDLEKKQTGPNLLLPPLILAIILGVILVYLSIPGSLIYPPQKVITGENRIISPILESEIKTNLQARIDELENALENGQCTNDGFVINQTEASLLPPTSINNEEPAVPSLLMPPANNIGFEATNLLEHLKSSTVLIIGENGMGSGFFINEKQIVTNAHVVSGSNGLFKIFSPSKEGFTNAKLLIKSDDLESSNQDYAILSSDTPSENYLTFSESTENLQMTGVVAAGFPGDFFETLEELESYGEGIEAEQVSLFVTDGIVSATQNFNAGGGIIIHSAEISPGSSGGPLVNACGLAVGINTMGFGAETRTLFISLRSDGLKSFLKQNDIQYAETSGTCRPKMTNTSAADG